MCFNHWLAVLISACFSSFCHAQTNWLSATLDNDMFVNSDNGYTNGLFLSWYKTGSGAEKPVPGTLVKPLVWSLPNQDYSAAVNANSVGQIMMTPEDITIKHPPEDSLPYSGVIFYNNTYIGVNDTYADKLSTTLGMVGPISGAKGAQTFVHRVRGFEKPRGWSTQLKNEPVFQLARGRAWRSFKSKNNNMDLIFNVDGAIGNLSSHIESGATVRVGSNLNLSYASVLLNNARTTNPVAINNSWYLYAGITASYVFNQIYTDGNTFQNSRSIDYDRQRLGFNAGVAAAVGRLSISIGFTDTDIFDNQAGDPLNDMTRYGTITIAWRCN